MHGPSAEKRARVHASGYFGSLILILCLNVQKARFYEPFLQCSNAASDSSQPYQLDGQKEVKKGGYSYSLSSASFRRRLGTNKKSHARNEVTIFIFF